MSKKWLILGSVSFSVGLSLSLIINRDIKQAALTGLLSVPATVAGVSITEHQRRQKLNDKISTQQRQLQGLVQQETDFNNSITLLSRRVESLKQQEKDIKTVISSLSTNQQQSQSELETIQNQVYELSDRKSNLEPKITRIEAKLQQLKEQETALTKSLANLFDSKKQVQKEIFNLSEQKQTLAEQLNSQQHSLNQLRQQRSDLEKAIATISDKKQKLAGQLQEQIAEREDRLSRLDEKLERFIVQEAELLKSLENLSNTKIALDIKLSNLPSYIDELEAEIERLINQKNEININLVNPEPAEVQIEFDFDELQDTVIKTNLIIQRLQIEPIIISEICKDIIKRKPQKIREIKLEDKKERVRENILDIDDNYNLDSFESIKSLWNNNIFPYWRHSDYPDGYRFLGNVDIKREESDRIINAVGKKLAKLVKHDRLTSSLEDNLLKLITFALSEYAYHYSERGEGFWEGFCNDINIEHNQKLKNILREITSAGIERLSLIKSQGGYKYVSTLWLQSGIPKKNMDHFATIVRNIVDEHGWWEIAHSSDLDVAEALRRCCKKKYRNWKTTGHFLKIDKIDEQTETIPERLVKNIAIVAIELEYQGITPEQLRDEEVKNKINEILHDSNLNISNDFFLRDWSDLITVLTPRKGKGDRSITKKRNQPPYLYLDFDTSNIQLIFPEQSLWEKEWQNLRGTNCSVPDAEWNSSIPNEDNLEIPELEIDIKEAKDKWSASHFCNK